MENLETVCIPEKIVFYKNSITMAEKGKGTHRISYQDVVLAYLKVWDEVSGSYQEPEITEITPEMDGEMILYDKGHKRWIIRTEKAGKKAGALLEELCIHAPYIMVGGQDWFDRSLESDFETIGQMVGLMTEVWCQKK